MKKLYSLVLLFLVVFQAGLWAEFEQPSLVYLTWEHSPQTTMTIQWLTSIKEPSNMFVEYFNSVDKTIHTVKANRNPLPHNEPFYLYRVELAGLSPGNEYNFRIMPDTFWYKFKTLPDNLERPLRFIVGGDIYRDDLDYVMEMNQTAAAISPDFALVGGDLAYSVAKIEGFFQHLNYKESFNRWYRWLRAWYIQMVTPQGHLIPIIPALGNHDVKSGEDFSLERTPFYYFLFRTPGYRVVDFSNFMSLFILDTGHTNPIAGKQTAWLENALKNRSAVPHKLALYHIGAFPSVRPFETAANEKIRKNWVPLFEKYSLQTAFEHHDHAYKRTFPIRNEKVDPTGVLYLGDGCWGIDQPRKPEKRWYLAATAASRHIILVTVDEQKKRYQAIDPRGRIIDEYTQILEETSLMPAIIN